MSVVDSIVSFFRKRRVNLDKPLTLLGKDYFKMLDKINSSISHSEYGDLNRGITYLRNDEEDRNVYICVWETVKIISFIEHDDNDVIFKAGKIYRDKEESFIDDIVKSFTAGRSRVQGRISYPHYDADDGDDYYHLDDITYMNVRKEYDIYDELWTVTVEYIRHKPAGRKKVPRKRTIAEDRQRILQDVDAQIDD